MNNEMAARAVSYACPKCKRALLPGSGDLRCSACGRAYPVIGGIPDFLAGDEGAGSAPVYGGTSGVTTVGRMARRMDLVSPFYESRLFVSALLRLSGVRIDGPRFIGRIADFHARTLEGIVGTVLDVACGPATYGRRTAAPGREVYGIDISMGMLRHGMDYVRRDRIEGIHLARARAEELPFGDAVFDGAICSGSLHLFPDTVLALREIGRTLKPGAPLSVQTFVAGHTLVNHFVQGHSWVHTFELPEIERDLVEAGLEAFRPELDGIVLMFSARKPSARL